MNIDADELNRMGSANVDDAEFENWAKGVKVPTA